MQLSRIGLFLLLVITLCGGLTAADWPMFRGPNGAGVAASGPAPRILDTQRNLVWKAVISPGKSSPVVVGGTVFLTAFRENIRIVIGLEAASGKELWRRKITAEREEERHPYNGPASPSPAADGQAVYVFFPEAGLAAFSHEGEPLWSIPLGPFDNLHGMAASPLVTEFGIVLLADHQKGSFIALYDKTDGKLRWRVDRRNTPGGYATPVLYEAKDGPNQILAPGPGGMSGYDIADGRVLWTVAGLGFQTLATPVISGPAVVLTTRGFDGEAPPFSAFLGMDANKDGAIQRDEFPIPMGGPRTIDLMDLNGDGNLTAEEYERQKDDVRGQRGVASVPLGGGDDRTGAIRWQLTKGLPEVTSPLFMDGLVYLVKNGGIVTVVDAETGEIVRQDRLREAIGEYWASPVGADGKIYAASTEGKVSVISAGRDWEVLSTIDLGEPIHASPAIADGRIYIRTERALYAFGE